jgi:hypothetical protein
MALLQARSPAEWYREAARFYLVAHQACVICHDRHCVFQSRSAERVEYSCASCGFSVCHEVRTSAYVVATGDEMEAECISQKSLAAAG